VFTPLFWLTIQEGIVALAEAIFHHSRGEQPKYAEDLEVHDDEESEDDAIFDGHFGLEKETPLIHACRAGDEEMVRFLMEAHADYHRKYVSDKTALIHACEHGHIDIVRGIHSFIMNGSWKVDPNDVSTGPHADVEKFRIFDEMLLACPVVEHNTTEGLEQNVYKQCWYRCGNATIHAAAHSGDLKLVEFLMYHGGDMKNAHGRTAKDILRWKETQSTPGPERSRRLEKIERMTAGPQVKETRYIRMRVQPTPTRKVTSQDEDPWSSQRWEDLQPTT
jgi:hypothetical protein